MPSKPPTITGLRWKFTAAQAGWKVRWRGRRRRIVSLPDIGQRRTVSDDRRTAHVALPVSDDPEGVADVLVPLEIPPGRLPQGTIGTAHWDTPWAVPAPRPIAAATNPVVASPTKNRLATPTTDLPLLMLHGDSIDAVGP